jgi:hypothetical protein
VIGRDDVRTLEEQLLEQLLAGPRAGEMHLDVRAGLQSGQTDEIHREIEHAYGLSHVEHEHFAMVAERRRLRTSCTASGWS